MCSQVSDVYNSSLESKLKSELLTYTFHLIAGESKAKTRKRHKTNRTKTRIGSISPKGHNLHHSSGKYHRRSPKGHTCNSPESNRTHRRISPKGHTCNSPEPNRIHRRSSSKGHKRHSRRTSPILPPEKAKVYRNKLIHSPPGFQATENLCVYTSKYLSNAENFELLILVPSADHTHRVTTAFPNSKVIIPFNGESRLNRQVCVALFGDFVANWRDLKEIKPKCIAILHSDLITSPVSILSGFEGQFDCRIVIVHSGHKVPEVQCQTVRLSTPLNDLLARFVHSRIICQSHENAFQDPKLEELIKLIQSNRQFKRIVIYTTPQKILRTMTFLASNLSQAQFDISRVDSETKPKIRTHIVRSFLSKLAPKNNMNVISQMNQVNQMNPFNFYNSLMNATNCINPINSNNQKTQIVLIVYPNLAHLLSNVKSLVIHLDLRSITADYYLKLAVGSSTQINHSVVLICKEEEPIIDALNEEFSLKFIRLERHFSIN